MVFAPVPLASVGVGRAKNVLLCGRMQETVETGVMVKVEAGAEVGRGMHGSVRWETETETEVKAEAEVEMGMCGSVRWESPEAWLVPSDSAEEADSYH